MMPSRTAGPVATVVTVCTLAWCATASAQGNSGFGHSHNGTRPSAPSSAPASSAAPGAAATSDAPIGVDVRNFGTWLDDASVLSEGNGAVAFGMAYWRGPGFREFDLPVLDSSVAVHRRVQVGMSFPYYFASEPGGPVTKGVGNAYLTSKVQLRDPSSHPLGFAVTPMLEVLEAAPAAGGGRVNWALPANVELQRKGWRAFGSGGYFSRGALFASGAIEAALSGRTWVMGSLSQTYSTRADTLTTALALPRGQTDLTGGLTFAVMRNVTVYGTLGHTISNREINSGTLNAGGGVSFAFQR